LADIRLSQIFRLIFGGYGEFSALGSAFTPSGPVREKVWLRKLEVVDECQTPYKIKTNKWTKRHGRLFVFCLSVVSVRGVNPMGERTAMLHRN